MECWATRRLSGRFQSLGVGASSALLPGGPIMGVFSWLRSVSSRVLHHVQRASLRFRCMCRDTDCDSAVHGDSSGQNRRTHTRAHMCMRCQGTSNIQFGLYMTCNVVLGLTATWYGCPHTRAANAGVSWCYMYSGARVVSTDQSCLRYSTPCS